MSGSCNNKSDVSPAHLGYWPGIPTNASYFFDYDVFHFWDTMQKNMPGSSCSAFVKTLAQISEKKGTVQVSILCIHCTIIMDLINSAAILWIYMFFFLFFLTTTLSTSLQAGIITPSIFSKAFQEWRCCQFELYLSSIWHEFYDLPILFQCSTCLSHRLKQENISLKKRECVSSFIPLFTVRTVLKVFINLKTYNFCYTVFKV